MFPQPVAVARPARSAVQPPSREIAHAEDSAVLPWQQRAVAAYRQSARDSLADLQHALISRVAALTDREIPERSIYVSAEAQLAVVNVEGVVFYLRRHDLTILRPCAECGIGQFESDAIVTLADLGYALSDWQPRCAHCAPADPCGWPDD